MITGFCRAAALTVQSSQRYILSVYTRSHDYIVKERKTHSTDMLLHQYYILFLFYYFEKPFLLCFGIHPRWHNIEDPLQRGHSLFTNDLELLP